MKKTNKQGDRVPLPTNDEMLFAMQERHEIAACSGAGSWPMIGMNIFFRNGDNSIVLVDELGAGFLLATLKALFPKLADIPAARVRETECGSGVQEGHIPPPR
jgi:hypothetical protein